MPDNYGTASGFANYHAARNRDVGQFEEPQIAGALLVASEWLDARYRSSFPGLKTGQRDQLREWPRSGANDIYGYAIDADSVPTEVDNATYELAYRQLQSPGSLSVDFSPPPYKSASVEGAVNVQYVQYGSASDVQTQFAVVAETLAPILRGCGTGGTSLSGGIART